MRYGFDLNLLDKWMVDPIEFPTEKGSKERKALPFPGDLILFFKYRESSATFRHLHVFFQPSALVFYNSQEIVGIKISPLLSFNIGYIQM